ncbi:putative UPF0481 protein At3g02645 [Cryptomeria japonica]|uniref:putative UPF0481 protein At3g02645 n=1 Tax=Cryptomeria japonica TaxID=3369 RepID=UPI0027D9ECD0|nr:putative UPF0481 protein At3g02645 [Cryptomeria japonica]
MEQKENEKFDEKWWVVQVESGLESEERSDESHDGLIHTVPKSLLSKNPEFYHPQVISLGPYHFQIKDPQKDDMERLKSEVARKMNRKIITKGGLKSVMEKFKEEEKQRKLKKSYAKNFELSSEACAWMIVRDACFLLEVLDRFGKDEGQEQSVKASMDSILSRARHHPLLTEIVKDMLKRENQLPFWALEEIRSDIVNSDDNVWFESALKTLSPIEIAERQGRKYRKESHILQLLQDYIVDKKDIIISDKLSRPWMTIIAFLRMVNKVTILKLLSPFLCCREKCVNGYLDYYMP